jgi:hypothetical protein
MAVGALPKEALIDAIEKELLNVEVKTNEWIINDQAAVTLTWPQF